MQPSDTVGGGGPRPVGPGPQPTSSTRRPGGFRFRNWRVTPRLVVLIMVPTVVAVALGGVRIAQSTERSDAYGRVEHMAELGRGITAFVQEFTAERDAAVEYSTSGRNDPALLRVLREQQRKTDALVAPLRASAAEVDDSYGAEAIRNAQTVTGRLGGLEGLRSLSAESKAPAITVLDKYSESVGELVAILDGISQNVADDELAESSRALGALARAKDAVSKQRALLLIGSVNGRLAVEETNALSAARAQEDSELDAFRAAASPQQRQRFDDTVVGTEIDTARDLRQRALAAAANGGQLPRQLATPRSRELVRQSMTVMLERMRTVERSIGDQLLAQSGDDKGAARMISVIEAVAVAVLLLIVLLVTSLMARSLVRPLRRLQAGALEVAGTRLPGLVDRLRDPEAAADGIEVEPIDVQSSDEIGQVARAFDEVHREAVRLAADEAVLRGNINAMFVNLSRRSQSLIERQLRLIEELEQSERDEEQLANLFRLDHLATRMRRNCENLLVLGGQDQVRRWNRPVPLIDVVRASLSEVEQYERVQLRVHGDLMVAGPVVNDLVHLLAELVENATVFSAEHTRVTVSGQMLSGGGAMLQITDNGVGMSPEELEQANWRLANPPVIDFSAARRMGLFVVGRLAVRHGVRVELRAAQAGGLTAFVVLPEMIIGPSESGGVGSRGFSDGSRNGEYAALGAGPGMPPAIGTTYLQGEVTGTGEYSTRPRLAATPPPPRDGYGPPPGYDNGYNPPSPYDNGLPPAYDNGYDGPLVPPPGGSGPMQLPPQGPEQGPRDTPRGLRGMRGMPGRRRDQGGPRPDETMHDSGGLPHREPGAQHPGRARPTGPPQQPAIPSPRQQSDESWRTAPLPVVPEAQPAVQETGPQSRPTWETGPLELPAPGRVEPLQTPQAQEHAPPQGERGLPARNARTGRPEPRSPIFDAMRSEWFQRRTDQTPEDPVKGWESPADAGFQAAEAAREPVAGERTTVGLPKRVPGRNRVPGAVAARGQTAQSAQPAQPPAPQGTGQQQAVPPAPGRTADVVRNRFAGLQSGVRRGRTEARGETGPGSEPASGDSAESPSQDEGGNGGAR